MADTLTGVTSSAPHTAPGGGGSKKQNQKLLLYGGGALALVLLMGRGGGGGGGSTPQNQLSAGTTGLDTSGLVPPQDATGAPIDTGGGSFTTQGPTATTAPAVDLTINTAAPNAAPNPATPAGAAPKPNAPKAKPKPKATAKKRVGTSKPGKPKTNPRPSSSHTHPAATHSAKAKAPTPAAKPKTPAKGKPAPATRAGTHPATKKKTPSGNKKRSPAEVESVRGLGAGQVIMGREFPGALSHRMGAPMRAADGTICRVVFIDYGGRTERHMVHGNGKRWTDRPAGMNPPMRGVPVNTAPIPV